MPVAAQQHEAVDRDDDLRAVEAAQRFGTPKPPRHGFDRDEHAARRTLRRQIARLEYQLSSAVTVDLIAGARGRVAGGGSAAQRQAVPHLRGLGELEQERDGLVTLLREVDARREAERANRALLRDMYRDPGAHRYRRLETRDLAERGCKVYEVAPRFGLIGILGGWWRVKVSSGCPLSRCSGQPVRSHGGEWRKDDDHHDR